MANEIRIPFQTGCTDLWAMVMFDDSGTWKVRDVTAGAWDVYNNADLDDYDIVLTEGPLGIYLGDAPSLSGWADGEYGVVAYQGSHVDGVETAVVINVASIRVRSEAVIDQFTDIDTILTDTTTDIPALIATAQSDLDTITGTGGVLIGTDAMDRSGTLDVNTKTVTNNAITAAAIADAAIDNATFAADVGSTAYATNIIALAVRKVMDELNLDHLMKVAVADRDALAEVVDDTVLANIMTKTDGDTSDFDHATDSLEGVRDAITANYLSILDILVDTTTLTEEVQFSTTVGATVTSATIFNLTAGVANDDAYNDATICVMDDSNSSLAEWRTIVDYTGSTKTVTLDRALSFTPEASTDVVFITGKTRNNNVAGGSANTYTVTDDGTALGNAVPDVHVWVTSDLGGNTIIASGTTDSNGAVIFYLDAGKTYYIWKHKAGSTFEAQPEIAVAV